MTEQEPKSECCPQCNGVGYFVVPRHARGCTWDKCVSTCPVPDQDMCDFCGGTGKVKEEKDAKK